MKKYRTPMKNRADYTYAFANGDKTTLTPGAGEVTSLMVERLHRLDDDEVNLQHRDDRNDGKFKTESTASLEAIDPNAIFVAGRSNEPLTNIIREETRAEVRAAVKKLPAAQQRAVVAVWFDETPAAEYAKAMGTSEANVSQLMGRAFKNLRKVLVR